MNVFIFSTKNGIVENSVRILDLCRTPETDPTDPWGSIEPRLRTTGLMFYASVCYAMACSNSWTCGLYFLFSIINFELNFDDAKYVLLNTNICQYGSSGQWDFV